MTFAMLDKILPEVLPKQLQTKVNFDTVQNIEMKKPEFVDSGLKEKSGDLVHKPQLNGNHYTPIIADVPNFRKELGALMSDEGFIKLPRSLLKSESWKSLRLRQQKLFLYILEKAQHTNYIFKYNGNSIPLNPGDLCISVRRLVDDFNSTVKFKDEKIDPPFVQRAVSAFSKHGLTDTRTDTGITIVTIIYPGIYDTQKNTTDTPTDTSSIQARYTNEERKEGEDIKETNDGVSSLLNLEIEEKQKAPSIFTPQSQPQALSEEKQKHYQLLWKFIVEHSMCDGRTPNGKPGIKEKDLQVWIAKYEGKEIIECLKMTLKTQPSKTWPGYVTKLLRDRIPKKEEDSQNGKKFVEEFVKNNRLKHIDMKQDYFKDLISNEQNYYNLPFSTLEAILKRSVERAKEREEEDRRQDEQDNY